MIGIVVLGLVVVMFIVSMKVCKTTGEALAVRIIRKEIGVNYGEKLNSNSAYKEAFNEEIDRIFKDDRFKKAFCVLTWSSELLLMGFITLIINVSSLMVYGESEERAIVLVINIFMLIAQVVLIMLSCVVLFRAFAEADIAGERAKIR